MFMFTDTAGGYTEVCVRLSKLAQPYTQDGWTYLQSELYLSNVDLNKQTRRPGGDLFPDSKLEPENFLMIGEKTSSIPGTPSDSGGRGGRGRLRPQQPCRLGPRASPRRGGKGVLPACLHAIGEKSTVSGAPRPFPQALWQGRPSGATLPSVRLG